VLVILGHWSLILQGAPFSCKLDFHSDGLIAFFIGVQLKATSIPGVGCRITETHNKFLAAIFIYSMCFDFIILSLNIYKLIGITSSPARDLKGRGRLTHIIFTDGLIFFILACIYISLEYKGSSAHPSVPVSCPISLRQYSWC
jgi:hypothetical protein